MISYSDLVSLSLSDKLIKLKQAYNFKEHPFFKWAASPTTSAKHFALVQVPFMDAVEKWRYTLHALASKAELHGQHKPILENLMEETGFIGSKQDHRATFAHYLSSLGLDAIPSEPQRFAGEIVYSASMAAFCATHSLFEGAACLGAVEYLYVDVSNIISRLIETREWNKEIKQKHYSLHEDLDIDHAKDLIDIASSAPHLNGEITLGLMFGAQHLWNLYASLLDYASTLKLIP